MTKKKRGFEEDALYDELADEFTDEESVAEEEKSRSQLKREMQARRDLGEALVALSPAQLVKCPLSEETLEAIHDGQRFTRRALKRQLTRIAALITEFDDEDAIRHALTQLDQPHRETVRRQHEAEQWRDALIAGDAALIQSLIERFPAIDRQHLRQLARNANKEREHNKPPRSARVLYQYLYSFIEP